MSETSHINQLPYGPVIRERLPSLEEALDPARMADRWQSVLWGPGVAGNAAAGNTPAAYAIEKCVPGKAILLADGMCAMQHALVIKDLARGTSFPGLINSRLYPEPAQAHAYYEEKLLPLLGRVDRHPSLIPYPAPAGVLGDLALAYAVFPVDGEIPPLLEATRPERILPIFQEALSENTLGFNPEGFTLDPAHYGRYQRCVLRYHLTGRKGGSGDLQEQLVFGKIDMSGQESLTVPVTFALQDFFRSGHCSYRFRIPLALAYLPNLKLLLMDTLPGKPLIKELLRDRLRGISPPGSASLTLEESIQACAQIAATIHQSGLGIGPRKSVWKELDELHEEIRVVLEWFPRFREAIEEPLVVVESLSDSTPPLPPVFSHGDFRYTQLIFLKKQAGLVDFGSICQAEPALDLGEFLAYQRMTMRKEYNAHPDQTAEGTDELCELFLTTYIKSTEDITEDEDHLRARVSFYEILNLLRLTVHSLQKLKGARAQAAMQVLQERIVCLLSVK